MRGKDMSRTITWEGKSLKMIFVFIGHQKVWETFDISPTIKKCGGGYCWSTILPEMTSTVPLIISIRESHVKYGPRIFKH